MTGAPISPDKLSHGLAVFVGGCAVLFLLALRMYTGLFGAELSNVTNKQWIGVVVVFGAIILIITVASAR